MCCERGPPGPGKGSAMKLKGYVGQGKGYDSATRVWSDDLKDLLGYIPYKGTLNVAIRPVLDEAEVLSNYRVSEPFKDFVCLEGELEGVKVHLCYSRRRKAPEIATFYVISEIKLRDKLDLKDKDKVDIEILATK
jgi:CTP-dependent riboflavin kinase